MWALNNHYILNKWNHSPGSKVHGANMGPIWVLSAPGWSPCRPYEPCYQGPYEGQFAQRKFYNKKPMCVASLTLIFTRSVGTLQPTRPLGRVGSKFNWPSEDQCQRNHSKWVFVFIPHLKSKYNQLIISKLSRKSAICPRRSPWRLIVLVRSLRSARLDTAWLVKSVTYFNLIG